MAYPESTIEAARRLYLQRYTPAEIRERLNIASVRVIYYWATKFQWFVKLDRDSVEEVIADRIQLLIQRDHKTDAEAREFDRLIDHHVKIMTERHRHLEKMQQLKCAGGGDSGGGGDLTFSDKPERKQRKQRKRSNNISELTDDDLNLFFDTLYDFQKTLYQNINKKRRNLLKARQIGATYYFAGEALIDAIKTGEDQIFLSASRRQALVFRNYMTKIALNLWGIQITGSNSIRLSNGAELHFLGTNKNTAQSNSGNLYIDEYMWIRDFATMNAVAGAISTRNRFRITWFSTPSSKAHQGYALWSGNAWRAGRADRKNIEFPTFDDYRDGGRDCPDNVWRYVVTLEDAVAGGITDIDIEDLKSNCSEQDYKMLYCCEFVDDKDSVFKFDQLLKCAIDTGAWQDYNPDSEFPLQNREIWAGFDPARVGDNAAFVLVCVPLVAGEVYRVIKVVQWHGLSFNYMAEQIQLLMQRFNIKYIGIDTTGIGYGVYELVKSFAPRETKPINYGVDSKNRLVMKMIDLIENRRINWNQDKKEIATAFLSVKRTTTKSGEQMTFIADRQNENHADIFFAIAHAMDNEPINYKYRKKSKWVIS